MQEPVKLDELDIKDLKSLAFDLIQQREEIQNNISLVLNEINKKNKQ